MALVVLITYFRAQPLRLSPATGWTLSWLMWPKPTWSSCFQLIPDFQWFAGKLNPPPDIDFSVTAVRLAFFQVGGLLLSRVAAADVTWYKDVLACSRVSPQFDLTLDENSVLRAIEQLNFIQMKRKFSLLCSSSMLVSYFDFGWL